jgi:aminoglycoside 6-adenylyltransferase
MRSESQIFELILSVAQRDERVRAVILNGSRANNKVAKDNLQDFDIVYLVEELDSFIANPNWIDIFGERIIFQTPNSMNLYEDDVNSNEEELVYLMLFKDYNRIDLTLIKTENRDKRKDSLTQILLDKDKLFKGVQSPNDKDYLIRKPTQKEFSDCCNEFWWVSTYMVKGLLRDEIIYAKNIQETIVRKMFMKIIAWNIAADYEFEINLGASYRFIQKYIDTKTMNQIKYTYSDFTKINIWNSLMSMSDTFHVQSIELARKLKLNYNLDEAMNTKKYIQEMNEEVLK